MDFHESIELPEFMQSYFENAPGEVISFARHIGLLVQRAMNEQEINPCARDVMCTVRDGQLVLQAQGVGPVRQVKVSPDGTEYLA